MGRNRLAGLEIELGDAMATADAARESFELARAAVESAQRQIESIKSERMPALSA